METFGERLGIARRELGLTQGDVAERVGITPRAYRFWEAGSREPSLEKLAMLSKILGVSVDWLLGIKDEM